MEATVDGILEATVFGSFTNIGYRLRSRGWDAPNRTPRATPTG